MDLNSSDDHIESQRLSGNNRSPPPSAAGEPPTTYRELSEDEKQYLLYNNGYLFGIHVDGNDGPRWSTCQVAKIKGPSPYPLLSNRETSAIVTEMISTETNRRTNYIHQGWSKSAVSTVTPWIISRIANSNHLEPLNDELSVTKRVTFQRLSVRLTPESLSPIPELEASIEDALSKPTHYRRFVALQEVFRFWGDVIALEFDLGTSMSITDLQTNVQSSSESNGPQDLATLKTARISTLGGEASCTANGDMAWANRDVPPHQWAQVRVLRVAPITGLLRREIEDQIVDLYSSLLSYYPPVLVGPINWFSNSFDGSSDALKTISSVVLRSNLFLVSIDTEYLDDTRSGAHGGNGGVVRKFALRNGEHITEVMIWADDTEWVHGLQFVTNYRKVSPHYGGEEGTPTILRSDDGILVAFSSKWKQHPKYKQDLFQHIQTIWRHDVALTRPDLRNMYFKYFGSAAGCPFNDLPFLESLDSACISSIRIKSGAVIDGIQITYAGTSRGGNIKSDAPYHGGQGGGEATFQLEPGEHIVTVSGRQKDEIVQLCFITNLGRTSAVYGGGAGTHFACQSPFTSEGIRMRLRYIAGKSGNSLNGLLLVWTRL